MQRGHGDVRSSGGIRDSDLHYYCGADLPVFNATSAGGRAIERSSLEGEPLRPNRAFGRKYIR
jgi:hypothetical protein